MNAKGTPSPQAPDCSFGRRMALPHTSYQVFSRNKSQHNFFGSEIVNEISAWTQDWFIWLIGFCIKANTAPQSVSAVAVSSESEPCTWMPDNISTPTPAVVHQSSAVCPQTNCPPSSNRLFRVESCQHHLLLHASSSAGSNFWKPSGLPPSFLRFCRSCRKMSSESTSC